MPPKSRVYDGKSVLALIWLRPYSATVTLGNATPIRNAVYKLPITYTNFMQVSNQLTTLP